MAALDGQPRPELEVHTVEARAGDRLLLCSDGLSDAIDDEIIADALEVASERNARSDWFGWPSMPAGATTSR